MIPEDRGERTIIGFVFPQQPEQNPYSIPFYSHSSLQDLNTHSQLQPRLHDAVAS